MENISVLGLGNWGITLANHLASNGHNVLGWSIEPEIVQSIDQTHRHPYLYKEIELEENLKATSSLQEALQNKIILLVIPSAALSDVLPQLKLQEDSTVISAIKGLEAQSIKTPLQYFGDKFPKITTAVISGPSFAKEVVAKKPCGIVVASRHQIVAQQVTDLFSNDYMRVYMSLDPLGVELGGIIKNVIAIAAGVSDGLCYGDSARAGLITRGLAEIMRMGTALGANPQTFSGLSGLGDLIMTATCDTSRNRTVGVKLGQGESLQSIVNTLGSVAEGVITTPLLVKLAQRHNVDMPITIQVNKLLTGEITAEDMLSSFINRPLKMEF